MPICSGLRTGGSIILYTVCGGLTGEASAALVLFTADSHWKETSNTCQSVCRDKRGPRLDVPPTRNSCGQVSRASYSPGSVTMSGMMSTSACLGISSTRSLAAARSIFSVKV
jgi:hypothetical protein